MSVFVKCHRPGCDFNNEGEEVPNMFAAMTAVEQHFNVAHPTKWFRRSNCADALEWWNMDAEEILTLCRGRVDYMQQYRERLNPVVLDPLIADVQAGRVQWQRPPVRAPQPGMPMDMDFVEVGDEGDF